jgi:kynureninase
VEKPGAQSYMLSNPAVLPTVCMQASLELFKLAGIEKLRQKSLMLTGYLEELLKRELGVIQGGSDDPASPAPSASSSAASAFTASSGPVVIRILTPSDPSARGAQLSLLFSVHVRDINTALALRGVVTDVREPNVIRVSPTPLYNCFQDVHKFVHVLKQVLADFNAKRQK